jgi:hypothetical protein
MEAGLPDTPAGQQLAWIIDAINADAPMTEEEFNERFSEEFGESLSIPGLLPGWDIFASSSCHAVFKASALWNDTVWCTMRSGIS